MVVSGKGKIGPILGIVGSALIIVAGFVTFITQGIYDIQLGLLGFTWNDIGFDPFILTMQRIITLIVGILGLIGAILALFGKKFGAILLLVFGIFAVVGSFVPMAILTINLATPITVVYPFFYVESILMVIGGILALVLR